MKPKVIKRIILESVVWITSLVVLVPFCMVLLNSLKDLAGANKMMLSFPEKFHWENYIKVIKEGNLVRSFLNSLLIAVFSVGLSVLGSSLAAYVLSRKKSKFNRGMYYFFLIGLVAPLNMVTVIKSMQFFRIMNTYHGIILLYAALLLPFSIFLYYGFIDSVPRSLDESAFMDGARPFTVYFRILFPLLKPVTVTVGVLNFMNAWNDFMTPLYVLNRSAKWPMTLAIYNFYGRRVSEWNLVFADIVITILPVIILYIVGQKYLVSGMTSGAIKG